MTIDLGKMRAAASAAFSPSKTTIGELGLEIILWRLYSGRGEGQCLYAHPLPSNHPAGRKSLIVFPSLSPLSMRQMK